jgi:hypothetical protein
MFVLLTGWGTVYYILWQKGELLEFVYLELFERTRKGVLTDLEVKAVEDELLANPRAGDVIVNTAGVRKVRAVQDHRGKSGSARVVYLYVEEQRTVYFVLAFPKNVQANLTADQKKLVRALVAQVRQQDWPRRRPARMTQAN